MLSGDSDCAETYQHRWEGREMIVIVIVIVIVSLKGRCTLYLQLKDHFHLRSKNKDNKTSVGTENSSAP